MVIDELVRRVDVSDVLRTGYVCKRHSTERVLF